MLPNVIISKRIMVGLIPGRIRCQMTCRLFAPSTLIASYKSGEMPIIAATKIMELNPKLCQEPDIT